LSGHVEAGARKRHGEGRESCNETGRSERLAKWVRTIGSDERERGKGADGQKGRGGARGGGRDRESEVETVGDQRAVPWPGTTARSVGIVILMCAKGSEGTGCYLGSAARGRQ
jgi:hypothetical protein